MKVKIVFFDCDGTLMFGNPWLKLNNAMGISHELDQKWLNQFLKGEISNARWTKNIEDHYIKNKLNRKTFEEILDLKNFTFNEEADELISYLKTQKIKIAIISSGIDYYISKVARNFEIKYWRDNAHFIFDKGGMFRKIAYGLDDLDEKVKDIDDICYLLNITPQDSIFVGDAANDTKAFEHTQRGILYKTKYVDSVKDIWANLDINLLKATWKKVKDLREVIRIIEDENKI